MLENEIMETGKKENQVSLRTQAGLVQVAQKYLKENGQIVLPQNYDVNSAIKSLFIKLVEMKVQNKPALEVITQTNIEQLVQQYVQKGLNIDKTQAYLIPYGNTLSLNPSYFGKQKQAETEANIKITSSVIHEGDKVQIIKRQDGTTVINHETSWENIGKVITGAYAVATDIGTGEINDSDIMTMAEINKSWAKSSTGGTVHKEFPHEMARKTVISRLSKKYINTSNDSAKFNVVSSDIGEVFEIDSKTLITDNVKKDKTHPPEKAIEIIDEVKPSKIVSETIDENAETYEIAYSEFINNKDKYKSVKDSYDKANRTIRVYKENEIKE
jgi:recombinational DNA repair protein RecT